MKKYLIILTFLLLSCKKSTSVENKTDISKKADSLKKDLKPLAPKKKAYLWYVSDFKGVKLRKTPDGEIINTLPYRECVFNLKELDSTFSKEEREEWINVEVSNFKHIRAFVPKSKLSSKKPVFIKKNEILFDSIETRELPLNDTIVNTYTGNNRLMCKQLKLDDFFPDCDNFNIKYQVKLNDSIVSLFCHYMVEGPVDAGEAPTMTKIINYHLKHKIIDILPIRLDDNRLNIYHKFETVFNLKKDTLSIFNKAIDSDSICNEKLYKIESTGRFIEIFDFDKKSDLNIDDFNYFYLTENSIINDEINGTFSFNSIDSLEFKKLNLRRFYENGDYINIKHKTEIKKSVTSVVVEHINELDGIVEVRLFNYDNNFNVMDNLVLYSNSETNRIVYEIFNDAIYITNTSLEADEHGLYKILKTEIYKINNIGQFVEHKIFNEHRK
ncbi:hypothetical protein [Psychroserpens sp. NJDZ02]|uniref:hypothetical protein n=1 Tax=Psychroserpens sp. NJDZ02 TaxID=2570561 RepID=UPI0010A8D67D|nr:hypothetical protein [Psychroserpens sp. NJDZ02]QCE43046.1 hypothetical protein E9099_17015 [Psychroserpens sp. NJDZ02]